MTIENNEVTFGNRKGPAIFVKLVDACSIVRRHAASYLVGHHEFLVLLLIMLYLKKNLIPQCHQSRFPLKPLCFCSGVSSFGLAGYTTASGVPENILT